MKSKQPSHLCETVEESTSTDMPAVVCNLLGGGASVVFDTFNIKPTVAQKRTSSLSKYYASCWDFK